MKEITVFTPTFNRAYCLHQIYDSLCNQTNDSFEWLIIDDGSTDKTKELVREWIKQDRIIINYVYKNNGGLHTAYNKAIERIKSELCICIDSDDFMPDNAIELILNHWKKYGNSNYAGIIGLDFDIDGKSIGGDLPPLKSIHLIELSTKYNYKGDTKIVHRSALLKEVAPMPSFIGEKNFNPIYMFLKVDMEYPLLVLNENLCFVEYQEDGMSNNILRQYLDSPNSFMELRKLNMSLQNVPYKFIFRNSIHYISSCLFAKNKNWFSNSPRKLTTIIALPFGVLLYVYIKIKLNGFN